MYRETPPPGSRTVWWTHRSDHEERRSPALLLAQPLADELVFVRGRRRAWQGLHGDGPGAGTAGRAHARVTPPQRARDDAGSREQTGGQQQPRVGQQRAPGHLQHRQRSVGDSGLSHFKQVDGNTATISINLACYVYCNVHNYNSISSNKQKMVIFIGFCFMATQ